MQPNWEASSIRSGGPVNPRRNSEGRQPQEPQRNRAFGSGPPDEDPDDFGSDGGSDGSNHEPEETGNPPQGRNFGGGNDLYNLQFANLRTPPPAKFDPKGKIPVREWIFKMEIWFQASRIPDDMKVMQAATLLEGHAFTWWMAKHRNNSIPTSWTQFRVEIIRQFDSINASVKARRQIRDLRQTGSVSDYENIFSTLMFQIMDMNEAEAFHQFKNNLKPFIQEKIDKLDINNLQELKEEAI